MQVFHLSSLVVAFVEMILIDAQSVGPKPLKLIPETSGIQEIPQVQADPELSVMYHDPARWIRLATCVR